MRDKDSRPSLLAPQVGRAGGIRKRLLASHHSVPELSRPSIHYALPRLPCAGHAATLQAMCVAAGFTVRMEPFDGKDTIGLLM